jgi:hypothetical protein
VDNILSEGLHAYAAEHAYLETTFADKVEGQWCEVRERVKAVLANLANGTCLDDAPQIVIEVELELDEDDI